jgi:hypothetical protein
MPPLSHYVVFTAHTVKQLSKNAPVAAAPQVVPANSSPPADSAPKVTFGRPPLPATAGLRDGTAPWELATP